MPVITENLRNHAGVALANRAASTELLDAVEFAQARTTGNTFYVHSGTGFDTSGFGTKPSHPYATLDYAVDQTTANKADLVFAMPGHVDSLAALETIDCDVAGISIIGLGNGPDRPRIDYDGTTASLDIGANGVLLQNLTFRPSVAAVLVGVDVEAGVTHTRIIDCEFLPGEAGDGTDEFVLGIDIKAGCTSTLIDNLRYSHHASAGGALACVRLTGASDLVTIKNSMMNITGAGAIACVNGITTLSTRLIVDNCILYVGAEPGVEMLTGTTGVCRDLAIFTDLGTIAAAIVADGMALFNCQYIESGGESQVVIGTPSDDDA